MTKLVDSITIPSPCTIPWESMQGSDTVRDCAQCSRKVYNLSAMTEAEAEKFLTKNGTSKCVTFFQRPDGTIMTQRCPTEIRKIWNGTKRVAALITSLCTSLMIAGKSSAQIDSQILTDQQVESNPDGHGQANNLNASGNQTDSIGRTPLNAQPARIFQGYVAPIQAKPPLNEASFLEEATRVVGLMGHAPKEQIVSKMWADPAYRKKQSKVALQQYALANHFRKEKKLRQSIEHYKRALEICTHLNSCGNTRSTIETELREVEIQRYYK